MSSSGAGNRLKTTVAPSRQQPSRAAKRPRFSGPAAEPQFPPEIWEHIFRFIPAWQLPRLRLICHHWNAVISGSSSLMDRCDVRIDASRLNRQMDQHYVPANLPPLVTQLVVRKFTIVSCDHWWPEFAQCLKELQLMYCTMTVDVLYGMLRRAPNLRRLVLYGAKLSGTAEPDFQLDRLTLLVVCCVGFEDNSRNILDGFERVFPRLEDLRLKNNSMPTNILQSIRTLQNSLQYLTLQSYPNVLDELSELQQLRLKMLGLDVDVLRDDLATWTKLCRNQPLLENLKMSSNCIHVLRETGRLLPRLKTFTLTVRNQMVASFLETMPRLEYLEISGCYDLISFRNYTSPSLERFVLETIETEDLFQYLQRSPRLRQMRLNNCKLGYCEAVTASLPNLTLLILDDLNCHPNSWFSLLAHSFNLEELTLVYLRYLDNGTMRKICKMLKHLKKLSLLRMRYLTDYSANHIIQHCRALEELEADYPFTEAALVRIESARNIHVKRPRARSDDEDDEEDDDE
ncbi:uncharacterized protein LOC120425653 [Culex pipiens pallens]|uniref:uncharacterized protein LOC120425653 n=1 Tax=Culex pipiens pallens TaxID=42434 RepID=UPI0019542935|nr:uncharacterized protein LOC120425653 [Culex pipiens pallens]